MKNKKKEIALSVLGIALLLVVTVGVAYAFFEYSKEGTKDNTVTVGNLKFLYTEVSGIGNGIQITDALPTEDTVGKVQTGAGNVFDFKVEANTNGAASIPYEITVVKSSDATLEEAVIKIYGTEVNGGVESALPLTTTGETVKKYSELSDTTISGAAGKTIYKGTVAANTTNYLKNFKVRMWIASDTDFGSGNYNGKIFTVKINVYANAEKTTVTSPSPSPSTTPGDGSYAIGDTVTLADGSKWHVLENSAAGEQTVVLLSDEKINPATMLLDETCRGEGNCSIAFDESDAREVANNSYCNDSSYGCNAYSKVDETYTNGTATGTVTQDSTIKQFIDLEFLPKLQEVIAGGDLTGLQATLPTAEQIATADGKTFTGVNLALTTPWLANGQNYLTRTPFLNNTHTIHYVSLSNEIASDSAFDEKGRFGLRPVITILKSNIQVS